MAAHVAERPGAEIQPFAPVIRMIIGIADEGAFGDQIKKGGEAKNRGEKD